MNKAVKTTARYFARVMLNRVLFLAAFGVVFYTQPMEMTFVAPESGAAQVQTEKSDYTKAMAKCETLPTGEFPTATVIEWKNGETAFSKSPGDANYLFKVAVGELSLNPLMKSFTLCR